MKLSFVDGRRLGEYARVRWRCGQKTRYRMSACTDHYQSESNGRVQACSWVVGCYGTDMKVFQYMSTSPRRRRFPSSPNRHFYPTSNRSPRLGQMTSTLYSFSISAFNVCWASGSPCTTKTFVSRGAIGSIHSSSSLWSACPYSGLAETFLTTELTFRKGGNR